MARKNKNMKKDSSPQAAPQPDLLTFDDAAEEQEPRASAIANYMDDFQTGFGAAAGEDSDEELAEAARANDEFERVTRIGALPKGVNSSPPKGRMGFTVKAEETTPDLLSTTVSTTPEQGTRRGAHAQADSYQSPYALQTGEEDLLSGASAAIRNSARETLTSVRSSEEAHDDLDEVQRWKVIKQALDLYADDKIVIAGDLLLKKIDQTTLHEVYCRESPKLGELMNRYYVIWSARRTMDAINMRRHQEAIENEKADEYNKQRKDMTDKKWREESWLSYSSYSWFKEKGDLEDSPGDRNTTLGAGFEDQPNDRTTRVWGGVGDEGEKNVTTGPSSDVSRQQQEKVGAWPKPSATTTSTSASPKPSGNNSFGGAMAAGTTSKDFSIDPADLNKELTMQEGTKYSHAVDTEKFSTWDLQQEHDGIRVAISPDVRYRDPTDESSRIYSSVVEGKVDIEFFPLLSMLNEVDLYPAWMEGSIGGKVAKCEVIERTSRSNFVVRMLFSMTWPLASRKVVFRVLAYDCLSPQDQVKQCAIVLEDVPLKEERQILARNPYWDVSHDAPYEGSIRARVQNSCVLVTPSGTPGETWIQSYCNVVPRMKSAPNWLVDSGYKNVAYNFITILRNARKVTKQAIYRDRQMDPNNHFYSWLKRRTREALPFERCPNAVSMGGIAPEDVELVRNLVQKAITLNEQMTTTVNVNGKSVVVDSRLFQGGEDCKKDFGVHSGKGKGSPKDLYEEDPSDAEGYTSSEDEGYGLLSGGVKTEEQASAGEKGGAAGAAGAGGAAKEKKDKLESLEKRVSAGPEDIGKEVTLVSNPNKTLDMAWAMQYVKLERRVTVLNVREGMKVRRGLHWKYGDEDLGVTPAGGYGIVVRWNAEDQIAKVKWHVPGGWVYSEQKKIGKYRLGPVFFDLAIYEDEVQAAVTEMLHNQMDPVRDVDGVKIAK